MKLHQRNTISMLTGAMLFAACSFAFAQGQPPVKIGASLILSGPGASAGNGRLGQIVIPMAINEINAAGGILGRRVEFVFADDAADPTRVVSEVKRLIDQEKIHALSGPAIAASALAAAPETTRAKIFSLPFTGARSITPQNYPYGFATFYASDAFSRAMLDYAVDVLKAKSLAVLVDTGAQGKQAAQEFKEYADKRKIPVAIESADFTSTDVTPQVLNLRRSGADAMLQVSSTELGAGRAYQATESVGWNVPIVSQVSALFPEQIKSLVGPNVFASGRLIGLTLKSSTMCPKDNPAQSAYVQLLTKIRAAAPQEAAKLPLPLASYFYDGVYLIKAAAEGAKSLDGAAMAAWLEQNSKNVRLVSGPIQASKTEHILFGSDVFAFVKRPDQPHASGLALREGC